MENANYMKEAPLTRFLKEVMDYEEHIKQWLLKAKEFVPLKRVHTVTRYGATNTKNTRIL